MVMTRRVPPSKQLNVRLTPDDQAELMAVMGKGWAWTPSDAVKRALIIAARVPAGEGFQILHDAMRERAAQERARTEGKETMAELRAMGSDEPTVPPTERTV